MSSTRWSDRTLSAVADLGGAIAETPRGEGPRGQVALEGMSRLIPFDCAVLCRTSGRVLSAVAAVGHRGSVGSAVARLEYRREQVELGMDASWAPLRFSDLPEGGRRSFTVMELARPAGLRDGMGMSIRSGDGAVVGHLALNAARDGAFGEEHRDLLALLHRPLAAALDARAPSPRSRALGLTPRELEVLTLVAHGHTNAEIAETLVISRSTVRRHVEHLLAKLGVSSRTAAAVTASRLGLVT